MSLPGYGGPPHNQRNPTDISAPEPTGFCDRTGFYFYLKDLVWQYQYTGATLTNTFLKVAEPYLDIPNEQARTIVIGPDPVPLKDPRPGYWASESAASGVPPLPPFVTEET